MIYESALIDNSAAAFASDTADLAELAELFKASSGSAMRVCAEKLWQSAQAAKTAAGWLNVLDSAVESYIATAEQVCEPAFYELPVFFERTRQHELAHAAEAEKLTFGGDRDAVMPPAPATLAVRLSRSPDTYSGYANVMTIDAFCETFRNLLMPKFSFLSLFKRAEYLELEALIDKLLFTLCGDVDLQYYKANAPAAAMSLDTFSCMCRIKLKLAVLENTLDSTSAFITL